MVTGARHLKMAELSSRSGVAASTIRHYLRLGLLPEPLRTAKTMAYYGPEHLERLAQIRRRLRAGATLREVEQELVGQAPSSPAADDQLLLSSQRARLVEAGLAVFLRSGFDAASVEDVVGRAGAGKAAFYRHFAGKRDLLAACLDRELGWYETVMARNCPSPERLMRYPDLFGQRRFRALMSLFALLRQADASSAAGGHDQAVELARGRLLAPLEADLRAGREAGGWLAGDERLGAEMLLSVAEYMLAYAAKSGSREVTDLVRHGWKIALAGDLHA